MIDADQPPNREPGTRRPPLQFGLRAVLMIMVAVSLLFGTLRWLDVPAQASAVVLVILIFSVAAALALVVAIAGAADDEP